jgi:hypothetical protein
MVVVVVGHQYHVDRGQRIERNSRWHPPPRTGEGDRGCALTPYRVCEHVLATDVDQERRMPNPRERQLIHRGPRAHDVRTCGRSNPRGGIAGARMGPAIDELPLEETRQTLRSSTGPRVAKSAAGVVVCLCHAEARARFTVLWGGREKPRGCGTSR